VVTAGRGDAGVPGWFQDPDSEVAQGGHDLRAAAGADLGGVFAVGDVADMVQGLDLPVAADPAGELGGRGLEVISLVLPSTLAWARTAPAC
jgi:hypothetical protein